MRKAFKYRAVISKETENNCFKWLTICRYLYNSMLDQKKSKYEETKESISCFDQIKQLPILKQKSPYIKQVNSQTLQAVIEKLDKSFKAFFRRVKTGEEPGFPRFKGSYRYNSFTLKQTGWKLEGRYLYVKNIGRFKLHLSRPVEGDIKTVTIKKSPTGKWFVTFSCDNVPERTFEKADKEVGIDVGIKVFCFDSENNFFDNPKYFREYEKLLRRRQRSLSRRKKGSGRRKKARLLVAKTHEKISNKRADFLHKTANYYIKNFNKIYIEGLKIKNMVKNRHLSKSIADSSWGKFFEFLAYKAEEAGRQVIKVNPKNTSRECNECHYISKLNRKSQSVFSCIKCGHTTHADLNASINILKVGQTFQDPTLALAGVS